MWIRVRKRHFFACCCAASAFFAFPASAQQTTARVTTTIDDAVRATIAGSRPPMAKTENDIGRVPSGTQLEGVKITFSRTPAEEADLEPLISAQQDPASPLYHQWLTPDEFSARFGVADADIAKVRSWLEGHGFTLEDASCGKTCIRFSGSVEQIETAFDTELHYYRLNGETHFAPSRDVSVPVALSSVVQTVTNLSTFRPKPRVRFAGPRPGAEPNFSSGQSGNHFLTPKDVATIYDINPAYKSGYNGAGQSLAVVGQSSIVLSDIEHFQTAAGFTVKDPTLVLVPNTGTAAVRTGDETESDLDLEYTSTIASGATVYFVYVGNSPNNSVFDAIQYAVTQKTAPIISVSYGLCETALGPAGYASLNAMFQQAAAQGQSVIVASGDSGSTDCYGEPGLSTTQQQALAVDFPASSQYVTALGGTEFLSADVASTNTTYWQPANGSDVISSALSYIPEQVWNDDMTAGSPASGGGGVSTLAPKPSWQAGVPGIPSGSSRLLPDISLSSSPFNAGYLFCSSDSSLGVTGSCANGFRDSNNTNLTVAGGTSFAAPIFAAMVAIINDNLSSSGQGVVSSTLYTLAANSTTYASAFHDITTGGNQCTLGSTTCSTAGASQYPATTGYDTASGLGSVDFFNLLSVWPGSSTALVHSKTTLSAASTTIASGSNDVITITVASASSSSTTRPTGTLAIAVDATVQTSSLTLVNGSATYTFSSTIPGPHVIAATYSGDAIYASSSGSVTVAVASAPVANAQSITTAVNTAKAITLTATPGTAGDTLTYTIVSNPAHGTLSGNAPSLTYTPTTGYIGPDRFTFDATENGVVSNTATVSIMVTAGPPPPLANNQSVSTNLNTAIAITLNGTPGTSGDTLTFVIAANPAHGTLSGTPPHATYTPATGYVGADSFTFNVTESNGATSTTPGTVSITVVRPPPVASKTTLLAASTLPAPGANDQITITVASASASSTVTPTGTLTIVVDGTLQTSTLALMNGSATHNFSSTTAGAHSVTATYSGDATYASSSGSLTVTVTAPPPVASKTTLSAASTTPAPLASDAITITVASASSSSTTTPTGTLSIVVDGTVQASALALANGSASYNFSSPAVGAHTITATYSGDSTYASSSGSLTLTVPAKSFKLAAANVTIVAGSSGSSIVTITPQNGYTGTVSWAVSGTPALSNGCFLMSNATVSGSSAVTATLTINTAASACPGSAVLSADPRGQHILAARNAPRDDGAPLATLHTTHAGVAIAGLLFVGLFGRRSRRLSTLSAVCFFAAIGFAVWGCASATPSPSPPSSLTAAKGTYLVTIVGTDAVSTSITASTTLTLTID